MLFHLISEYLFIYSPRFSPPAISKCYQSFIAVTQAIPNPPISSGYGRSCTVLHSCNTHQQNNGHDSFVICIFSHLKDPVITIFLNKTQEADTPGVHQPLVGCCCHSTCAFAIQGMKLSIQTCKCKLSDLDKEAVLAC